MAACIGREGDCMERMELKQPAEVFSLGDWVRVPVTEMGNFFFCCRACNLCEQQVFLL